MKYITQNNLVIDEIKTLANDVVGSIILERLLGAKLLSFTSFYSNHVFALVLRGIKPQFDEEKVRLSKGHKPN